MRQIVAGFTGIFLSLFVAMAEAAPQLVIPVTPTSSAKSSPQFRPGSTAVRFNRDELFALPQGTEVEFTLPSALQQSYIYERTIDHGGGIRTWIARGSLAGDRERAVITSGPGGTWGWIKTPENEWRIYPGEANEWLMERPPMSYAPKFRGGDAIEAPMDGEEVALFKGVPTSAPDFAMEKSLAVPKATPSDPKQVDVMIIYTKDLATKLGGGLLPMLNNLIVSSNQAFSDSEIALSLRLVYATMLDLSNSSGSSDTLGSMANFGGSNATLFGPLTWQPGSVRDQVGADIVALVRDGPDDTGGIAYILKNPSIYPVVSAPATAAYSVNNYCASGCESIFAHELGHNMGSAHDPATIAYDNGGTFLPTGGVFTYSFGHYDCANGLTCNPFTPGSGCNDLISPLPERPRCAAGVSSIANDFGTIMSYFFPVVMKFSNPNVFCKPGTQGATSPGRACGTVDRDNSLSMNNVRQNISAYRNQTIASLPGSLQFTLSSYSGTESGGVVTFTVSRSGGSSGPVSVNYTVSGGTAIAGIDFVVANGTLSWGNGDGASKTFSVVLTNDLAVEGIETFTATLSSPAGSTGVYLGHPTSATGVISEAWPIGGVAPPGFTAPVSSVAPWAIANDSSGDADGISFKSGAFTSSQTGISSTQFSGNFMAGTVSFAYRVSSYPSLGFFEFLVDGGVVRNDSGDSGWKVFSIPVTAGAHTLEWRYRKTFPHFCANLNPPPPQGTACADRAWIDSVSLPLVLTGSSTTLASSANPSNAGQPVTFTATINASGTPAGTVTFFDGGTPITNCSAVLVASGAAACTTSAVPAGIRTITAAYSGSTTHGASLSVGMSQTVLGTHTLTVTRSGAGTVSSSPAGIACGSTCAASFAVDSSVALTATADTGAVFAGWSGACTGSGACSVSMSNSQAVTATFATVAATPTPQANPTSLAVGGQSMNTTAPIRTVTITNVGMGTLTISGLTAPQHFAQQSSCSPLSSGATCTIYVAFTPTVEGNVAGDLVVQTSNGTLNVALTGTGEKSLVTHYYQSILRRAPDVGGKLFWTNEAERVRLLDVNVNEVWFSMAQTFYTSAEYLAFGRDNTGFVTDLFNTFFNRLPDAAGLAYWKGQLDQGLPREVALVAFMFSTEFSNFTQAIFGNTVVRAENNTVTDFYRGLLSRLPDNGGIAFWLGKFRTAQCTGAGAVNAEVESISSLFANSQEYANRSRSNAEFVGDLYNAFLRRGGDLGGVQFWINQIDTGARSREVVRQAFIASPEFQARVAAIIAQGCVN